MKTTNKLHLFMDSVTSHELILGYISSSGQVIKKELIKNGSRTEKLLPGLIKFMNGQAKQVAGIIVVQGSGSFSQSRLVCTIANSLAYAWDIRVTAVNLASIKDAAAKLKQLRWQKLLQPYYRGPGVG